MIVSPKGLDAQRTRAFPVRTRGFSLIELVVAMLIFGIGTLGLAGMTAGLQRQAVAAGLQSERNSAVISAVEQVRAMDFDSLSNGAAVTGQFNTTWSVTPSGPYSKAVRIVTSGPALVLGSGGAYLASSLADTLEYPVVRP